MRDINALIADARAETLREEFPIDRPVFERAGRDPLEPVLYAGSLKAKVVVLGRDLGKDEVAAAQPLIGAGGRLVRSGVYEAVHGIAPPASDRALESVLEHALLTNTVPYKPPGNKAYSKGVKERFRPFVAELLVEQWTGGDHVITLGNEAFAWFARYGDASALETFWEREDRYESRIPCEVVSGSNRRRLILLPLPHPSPLNARWFKRFPELLAKRLRPLLGRNH